MDSNSIAECGCFPSPAVPRFQIGKPINFSWFSTLHYPIALAGLIGDVFLNKTPLRNFKIYSLEMKPGFMKRFVGFKSFLFLFETNCFPAVQNLIGSS